MDVPSTQVFDIKLERSEIRGLENLLRLDGCKAKFKIRPEAKLEVIIDVEVKMEPKEPKP